MRWQMARNQFRNSGLANRIISTVLIVLAAAGSLGSFIFAVGWGRFFLAKIEPFYVIYVWDVLGAVFLFGWAITLMVELQRSEMLSLKNLLHLPISLKSAFFLNYTSSLVSLVLLLFLPGAVGLCVASVMHFGARSIVVFALLGSFLLMITAITYQLRGWLARLMENKRTRGTVITVTTIVFVMIFQIPNMINLGTIGGRGKGRRERLKVFQKELEKLEERFKAEEIDADAYKELSIVTKTDFEEQEKKISDARTASINRTAEIVNLAIPVGWLPYGASAAARGSLVSPWLCVFGMSGIGFVSLTLAYRSTLRAYTGHHNKGYQPASQKSSRAVVRGEMLEKSVPLLNEQQSVITMATLRSTLRAPEAKMALLTPLIFACVFGSMMLTGKMDKVPAIARPWFGVGALCMSLVGMVQMILNMFGLDRQGFRAYVLMPAPRRDILLGKNMGIFPVAAVLTGTLVVFMGVAGKMQFTHIVATLLQIAIVFPLYFIVSNYTSIAAPIGIAAGTMKPVSMKFSVVVMQFISVLLAPVAVFPAAIALGAEQLAGLYANVGAVPIYLLLTLIEMPIAIWLYRRMLTLQGAHLRDREQYILDVISKVVD